MTSNSISLRNRIARLDPAWRWAVGVYLGARMFYSLWSIVVMLVAPSVLENLTLFGVPVVAFFDVASGERYVYARTVRGRILTFRTADAGMIRDVETDSVWSLQNAQAIRGALAGETLQNAAYTAEDVFPYRGVKASRNPLFGVWQRFDTNWYLKIAQRGYSGDDGSTVYFPLYPLLIRALGTILGGDDLIAAIVISNIALVIALYLLYRLTEELFDATSARRSLLYIVIFPTAFFWFSAYTESVFFLFALATLFFARRGHWWWSGIFGALGALTRLQDVLLVIPLAYLAWADVAGGRKQEAGREGRDARDRRQGAEGGGSRQMVGQMLSVGLPLVLIPFATAAFLIIHNLTLFESYRGELYARFVLPWENLWVSVALVLRGQANVADVGNLIVMLLFGAMLIPVWRTLPREFGLYAAVMFFAPLFRMTTTQPLVSMLRYVLVLFPVFMLWAMWGRNAWVNRAVIYISFPLSLYFSAQFWLWGWVA